MGDMSTDRLGVDDAARRKILDDIGASSWPPIYLSDQADVLKEARVNMRSLRISPEVAREITATEVLGQLELIIDEWNGQLRKLGAEGRFYMWFDEQIPELRFSLISRVHERLPFSGSIQLVSSPIPILQDYLASPDHGGLAVDAPAGGPFEAPTVEDQPQPPLAVFTAVLPSGRLGTSADGS